jgi:hypothetical protein
MQLRQMQATELITDRVSLNANRKRLGRAHSGDSPLCGTNQCGSGCGMRAQRQQKVDAFLCSTWYWLASGDSYRRFTPGWMCSTPSSWASQEATFLLVHKPPSGAGSSRAAASFSRTSGGTRGACPGFWWRRSPTPSGRAIASKSGKISCFYGAK